MVEGLNSILQRLRSGRWRCHQWLPLLGYMTVLMSMQIGLGGSPSDWRAPLWPPAERASTARGSDGQPIEGWGATLPGHTVNSLVPGSGRQPLLREPINKEMVAVLKEATLRTPWSMTELTLSSSRMAEKSGSQGGEVRKQHFIRALLPFLMIALNEVRQEREQLLAILAELDGRTVDLTFTEDQPVWQQRLGADKTKFILSLVRKYRTASASELVAMVNVLPPSLIIAQGALESSWGGSRYAIEANNLFGMYSSARATLPNDGEGGKGPRILEYSSILESVRAYVLNINRLPAYKELRRIRSQTLDPMRIAEGLLRYSERKEYYIIDIKKIIVLNKLQDYDTLIQAAG